MRSFDEVVSGILSADDVDLKPSAEQLPESKVANLYSVIGVLIVIAGVMALLGAEQGNDGLALSIGIIVGGVFTFAVGRVVQYIFDIRTYSRQIVDLLAERNNA